MPDTSNLSRHAVSFPLRADSVQHILTDFNIFLKLKSQALKDNTYSVLALQFLQAQKNLQEQVSYVISADMPIPSAESNIPQPPTIFSNADMLSPSVPSLSNRQRKQQLRASNYRAKKLASSHYSVPVDTHSNNRKFYKPKTQYYPKSSRPNFSKYLQDYNDGKYDEHGCLIRRCLRTSSAIVCHTLPSFLNAHPPPITRK